MAKLQRPKKHAIGIDIGFRQLQGGVIRAATIGGTAKDFAFEKVELHQDYIKRMNHIEDLQSEMDDSATKLGVAIIRNKKHETVGIFTDGDIKRILQKNHNLKKQPIKFYMTKNPVSINKDVLAANALGLMNEKKITTLCVYGNSNKKKTLGILHIHSLLNLDIS